MSKFLQTIKAKSIMDRLVSLGQAVSGNPQDYGFFVDDQIDSRFSMVRRIFIADEDTLSISSENIFTKPLTLNGTEIFSEGFPAKMLYPSRSNFLSEINAAGDTQNGASIKGEFSNPDGHNKLFIILELTN